MKHIRNQAYLILVITTFIWYPSIVQAQQVWTFDECIEYAVNHNMEIQHRMMLQLTNKVNLQESSTARLPRLNAKLEQAFSFGQNISTGTQINDDLSYTALKVNVAIPIFTGFRIPNQIKADKFSLLAATERLELAKKDIRIQVAAAYLQILYYKGRAQIAQKQVDVSLSLVDKAKSLVDDGKRPESELAEAEAQLSSDDYVLTEAKGNVTLARLNLSQLLNLPDMDDFDVVNLDTVSFFSANDIDARVLYDDVVESYPSIMASKYLLESAFYGIKVARSGYYPELSLQALYANYYCKPFNRSVDGFGKQLRNNDNMIIGLSLAIPIFNGLSTRNAIRKAKIVKMDAEISLNDSRQVLRKEIQQAYYNAIIARDRYVAACKAETSNSISFNYEQESYLSERATLFDLSQSRQKWFTAQEDALQAKYEYLIRVKILDFYKN